MFIRIFKVEIRNEQRDAFEKDFHSISVEEVESKAGFISCEIGMPTLWCPNEYVMITKWENEQSLAKFAGRNWNVAVIPKQMEKYVVECSVAHYEISNFNL